LVLAAGVGEETGADAGLEADGDFAKSDSFGTRYEATLLSLQLPRSNPAARRGIRLKRLWAAMWMGGIYALTGNFKPFPSNKFSRRRARNLNP
jgi:hypothetical protein